MKVCLNVGSDHWVGVLQWLTDLNSRIFSFNLYRDHSCQPVVRQDMATLHVQCTVRRAADLRRVGGRRVATDSCLPTPFAFR